MDKERKGIIYGPNCIHFLVVIIEKAKAEFYSKQTKFSLQVLETKLQQLKIET